MCYLTYHGHGDYATCVARHYLKLHEEMRSMAMLEKGISIHMKSFHQLKTLDHIVLDMMMQQHRDVNADIPSTSMIDFMIAADSHLLSSLHGKVADQSVGTYIRTWLQYAEILCAVDSSIYLNEEHDGSGRLGGEGAARMLRWKKGIRAYLIVLKLQQLFDISGDEYTVVIYRLQGCFVHITDEYSYMDTSYDRVIGAYDMIGSSLYSYISSVS